MACADGLVLQLHDRGFGGQQEACNRGGVLEGDAFDLGGDDDAHGDEVAVLVGQGVVAERVIVGFLDLGGDDRAVEAAVLGDLLDWG